MQPPNVVKLLRFKIFSGEFVLAHVAYHRYQDNLT